MNAGIGLSIPQPHTPHPNTPPPYPQQYPLVRSFVTTYDWSSFNWFRSNSPPRSTKPFNIRYSILSTSRIIPPISYHHSLSCTRLNGYWTTATCIKFKCIKIKSALHVHVSGIHQLLWYKLLSMVPLQRLIIGQTTKKYHNVHLRTSSS